MRLRDRLDTLRRQGGNSPGGGRARDDLNDRLRRLRGATRHAAPVGGAALTDAQLAERLGAVVVARGLVRLDSDLALPRGARETATRLPGQPPSLPGRSVFLDTETSGLAGGAGTVVFMVGLAWQCGGRFRVRQYLLHGFAGEAAMLQALRDDLDAAEVIVSYNGKSFDLPLLCGRLRLHDLGSDLPPRRHLDLLYPIRALFSGHWPDCRLATAESRLLEARQEDLPGSQAPSVWLELLRQQGIERLVPLLAHNRDDLLALVALLAPLEQAYKNPLYYGAEPLAAARAWQRAGDAEAARRVLAAGGDGLDPRGQRELARLHRQQGDWPAAIAIWEALAAAGCAASREDLAKYQEHVVGDWRRALGWAAALPDGARVCARRRRLQAKLAGGAGRQLALPW